MADEVPADDEFEAEELDEEEIDGDELVDDDLETPVGDGIDDEVVVAVIADDEEDDDEVPAAARKKEDEDDDDEEVDPDDVEADLARILKDRIAANEDDDDEEEVAAPRPTTETPDGVQPKKAHEFMCTGCFLLVNPGQFGPVGAMECPVGEEICPAIDTLTKQLSKARK